MYYDSFSNRRARSILAKIALLLVFAVQTITAQNRETTPPETKTREAFSIGGRSVSIPAPANDMVNYLGDEAGAESLVPPYNRLITAFVPDSERNKALGIERKAPSRLALIQVPRQFESMEISEAGFKVIVQEAAKQFDSNVESYAQENEEEFNKRLSLLGLDLKMTFDKPVSLGVLFSKPDATAFGTVLRVSAGSASITKVLSLIYMRAKNRVVYAYFFADYQDQGSISELRRTSERWANAILESNR
jgi:hypothetical protein